jgi:hypothetical protein
MQLIETKDRKAMSEARAAEAAEVFIGPEEKAKILELAAAFRAAHKSDSGMLEVAEVYFVAAAVLARRLNEDPAQFDKFMTAVISTIDGK